jgi:hypothetical protein
LANIIQRRYGVNEGVGLYKLFPGGRIVDFASDQDKVLKALNEYQLSLWDNMIWPMLSSTEGDQKENQVKIVSVVSLLTRKKERREKCKASLEQYKERKKE